MIKAVISVIGRDQKGVVASFATYVAQRGINIQDIKQQVVHGQFIMDMLIDLAEMTVTLDQLVTGMLELGRQIDMEVRLSLHDQRRNKKIALLVSKESHCLEQLIEDQAHGKLRGQIDCVLSNHPTLQETAAKANLPFEYLPSTDKPAHMAWLLERLKNRQIDLIVLARYMQIASPSVVQAYSHRIINIHPSLLPHFPGASLYRQAWESGVRVTGCTAHFVTESLDEGPIILQDVFHIEVGRDSAEEVKRKGLALEGQVLSSAVQMFLDEKLAVVDGKVVFRPGLSRMLEESGGAM